MWGKRTREKQTVPQQFLNTCDYFQHKTQTEDVCTYNRVMQNWNVRDLYRVSGKDILYWVELALHEAFQGQHAGKIWVRVSVWQCRKWGLHGLYISRRKSSIADLIGIILCYLKMFLLFFYWHWVLSTNNFLFLLITPVNSGYTKVNIKGVKK